MDVVNRLYQVAVDIYRSYHDSRDRIAQDTRDRRTIELFEQIRPLFWHPQLIPPYLHREFVAAKWGLTSRRLLDNL